MSPLAILPKNVMGVEVWDSIGENFGFIVDSYGFDVDIEDVIATRDW
jgi:Family of unknown function (DUF5713)